MFNSKLISSAFLSIAGLVAACGGVDTASGGSTGSGWVGASTSSGTAGGSTGTGPDCMAPQQPCGGVCVDTSADPGNCKTCGHSCQGGTCVVSRCQPVTLASAQDGAYHLAVNAAGVYWNRGGNGVNNGMVMMLPAAGGMPFPLASGQQSAVGFAVDATNVYWTSGYDVMKVPAGGGNVTKLATATMFGAGAVAVAATSVYWADGAGAVMKVPIGGGSSTPLAKNASPISMAADATSVYWMDQPSGSNSVKNVMKVPIAGGQVTTLVSGVGVGPIALDATHVYWIDETAKEIMRVPINGGPATSVATVSGAPFSLAVDETSVYWTNLDAMGTVMKAPKAGGEPESIALGHGFSTGIAVDATSVYWTDGGGLNMFVMKVAK
jgi:hypothetical protein